MTSKKILILYDYFDPAYKAGGPIRSLVNLVKLVEKKVQIYVLTTNQDHDGTTLDVITDQWITYGISSRVMYLTKRRRGFGSFKSIISELNPNLVYLNGIFSLSFVVYPLLVTKKLKNTKIVIAPRGMLQKGALEIKSTKKRAYLKAVKLLLPKKELLIWHATDDQEIIDIKRFSTKYKILLAGNIPAFDSSIAIDASQYKIQFVSVSLLARKKNHLAFLKALKKIKTETQIEYHIYGPISDKAYFELIVKEMSTFPSNIIVKYMGELHPSKVGETLNKYQFYVLTSFGENFGHSIFEAFNHGIPVITSDQTPWKALKDKEAGWDVNLNHSGAMVNAIEEAVQMDTATYLAFRHGARKVAEEYMRANNFVADYLKLFSS